MERYQKQVSEFMTAAGQQVRSKPGVPSKEELILSARLIIEEALEYVEAAGITITLGETTIDRYTKLEFSQEREADIVEMADAVADLAYIGYGRACSMGVDMEPIENEVHFNNLSKIKTGYRDEHGKLRKGPDYVKIDLRPIIEKQCTSQ